MEVKIEVAKTVEVQKKSLFIYLFLIIFFLYFLTHSYLYKAMNLLGS